MTKQKSSKFVSLQIKEEYKQELQNAAFKLSLDVQERVTVSSLIYVLVENFLDKAVEIKRKDY
jgi:hypothetical protein